MRRRPPSTTRTGPLCPYTTRFRSDVPTIDEAGVPQITVSQWAGVFGPPKMPREIVERLNREVNAALKRQDVLDRLQGYGYAAQGRSEEHTSELQSLMRSSYAVVCLKKKTTTIQLPTSSSFFM